MMRSKIALLAFLMVVSTLARAQQDESRPHVIVIMVDDLSVADISLNGNALVKTPNIDRLAREGTNFTNAYVTSPVCSPSRASFVTGRYAQRFGFQFQMHERYPKNQLEYLGFKWFVKSYPWIPKKLDKIPSREEIDLQGMPASEVLLPQLLQESGYRTALIGKWHLGWHETNTPCNFGFDYQYGFYGSHSLYIAEGTPGYIDQKVPNDFTDKHIWKGQRDGPHAIYRNCQEIEETGYLTDRITDESIAFLERQKDAPFFLWVSYNAPHSPFQCKQEHYDQLAHIIDPIKRVYNAMILSLDENIGRLLGAVEKQGFEENTLVIFLSDNGGAEYTFATDNGNYKGGKITDLEGGVRVPMFMKWPGNLLPGSSYAKPVLAMDLFTTIMHATGTRLPTDRTYDGVDLMPFISGQNPGAPHEYLYWQRGISRAIRSARYKLFVNTLLADTLLFDLAVDPFEEQDLYAENKPLARELAAALNRWSATLPEPLWPAVIYYEFMDGERRYLFDQ
jgi:arylsulfatase A-like enzyme